MACHFPEGAFDDPKQRKFSLADLVLEDMSMDTENASTSFRRQFLNRLPQSSKFLSTVDMGEREAQLKEHKNEVSLREILYIIDASEGAGLGRFREQGMYTLDVVLSWSLQGV